MNTTEDKTDTSTAHTEFDTVPVTRLGNLRALKPGELAHIATSVRELHDAAVSRSPVFTPQRVKVLFDSTTWVLELHEQYDLLLNRDLIELLTALVGRLTDESVAKTSADLFGSESEPGLRDLLAALLSDVHLIQQEKELTERLTHVLTPAGQRQLEHQLKTVQFEIDHLIEVGKLSEGFRP